MRAMHDRIIVEPKEQDEVSAGGIHIPTDANVKERAVGGTVVGLGTEKQLDDGSEYKFEVNIGDEIIYGKYSGTEIKGDEDKKYVVMKESDVLVIK